jgi:DNA ligase (NAD+)
MTVDKMVAKLKEAKQAYYDGNPIMSDAEFDKLEDDLRTKAPKADYFKLVGTDETGNTKTKFKHDIPMLSCGKAKTVAEVMTWLGKIATPKTKLIVQGKIDGLSATAIYMDGKLKTVATRGDGVIGQDITHIAKFVNIPSKIEHKGRVEVRGELYIPKNSKVPNPDEKPLRNIAVGLINRKGGKHSLDDLKYVHFVTYQLHGTSFSNSELYKMQNLKNNGFEVVEYDLVEGEKAIDTYRENYLDHVRDAWQYETDGLVFTVDYNSKLDTIDGKYEVSHHHHYNIALKPPAVGKETELIDIEWNVSRQGKLIPVAIVKPVVMGGATIQRCTLNNFENVLKLNLHKGDRVIIERANDVIPFFKENLTKHTKATKDVLPILCPHCDVKVQVEGIHLVCNNSKCGEQNVKKIIHWVKNCEMEQFSEKSVRALFEAGKLKTVRDLYSLTQKDFAGLEGFGERKITNALKQIETTKEMNIGEFVDRLGIDLVGEKAIKKLGITNEKELMAHKDRTYRIGENLMDFVAENKAFVKELLSCVTITEIVEEVAGANNVCFTGTGPKKRDDLIADIRAKGDNYLDRVSKELNILVCADTSGNSSKLQKARKFGVQLMTYDEYFG